MQSIQGKKVATARCGCEIEVKRSAVGLRSDMPHPGRRGRAGHGTTIFDGSQALAWFSSATLVSGFGWQLVASTVIAAALRSTRSDDPDGRRANHSPKLPL